MPLFVNETFYSIQGESTYAGYPCVFVRLTGCNLRCTYCDTAYAYDEGDVTTINEIIDKIQAYDCPIIEITGGEPLIQKETPHLIKQLLDQGFKVLLETNGSQDISQVDERCVKIVDIKCPSSGESSKNDLENIKRLSKKDEIKFVMGNREDYEYARSISEQIHSTFFHINPIHFSPIYGKIEPQELAEWILEDKLNVRLQLQLHKIIWNPNKRGV